MTDQPSVLTERTGATVVITLNRPDARNAVDADVAGRVADALDEADADRDVRCIVLTGAGEKAFCAGADLKALGRGEAPLAPGREHHGFAGFVRHPVSTPVIAAVNGAALGGGMELVLASDLAVAAETATFGLPEISRGIFAAAGGVLRLPEQLPRKVAMRMVLTGEAMPATDALRWGLVNEVVPRERLLETAREWARKIGSYSPTALRFLKHSFNADSDHLSGISHLAFDGLTQFAVSEEGMEGARAFAEKRPPDFRRFR